METIPAGPTWAADPFEAQSFLRLEAQEEVRTSKPQERFNVPLLEGVIYQRI